MFSSASEAAEHEVLASEHRWDGNESFLFRARVDDAATLDPRQQWRAEKHLKVGKNTLWQMLRVLEEEDEEGEGDGGPAGGGMATSSATETEHPRNAGKYTVVAFVNSGSGGGVGKSIFNDLVRHLGAEYVVDLKTVGKGSMPEDYLVKYARDPHVRILACGGDGTVGWIASSTDKVWKKVFRYEQRENPKRSLFLPIAIMPLGTGNDLSRQFQWGGTFREHMRGTSMIQDVEEGRPTFLDRWRVVVLPLERLDDEARAWVPQMLGENTAADYEHSAAAQSAVAVSMMEGLLAEGDVDGIDADGSTASVESAAADRGFFDGVFCNYFSIGFDARIAFAFHKEREEHPDKFTSPAANKAVYVKKTPKAYAKSPQLNGNMRVLVKNEESGETEELPIPDRCKALVLMNIQSYGGGQHLTSSLDDRADDGLIEVLFLSSFTRAATAASSPFKIKAAVRTSMVSIRTHRSLHCQVDGEPWYQGRSVIQIRHHTRNAFLERVKK